VGLATDPWLVWTETWTHSCGSTSRWDRYEVAAGVIVTRADVSRREGFWEAGFSLIVPVETPIAADPTKLYPMSVPRSDGSQAVASRLEN